MNTQALSFKFLSWLAGVILVSVCLTGSFAYWTESHDNAIAMEQRNALWSDLAALVLRSPLYNDERSQIESVVKSFLREQSIVGMQVYSDAELVFQEFHQDNGALVAPDQIEAYLSDFIQIPRKIDDDDQLIGSLKVYFTDKYVKERDTAMVVGLILRGLFTLVIVLAVSAWLIRQVVTKPIAVVVQRLKVVAEGEGDLTKTIPISSNDEIGKLSCHFNRFLSSLRQMVISINQEVEALSHQSNELQGLSRSLTQNADSQTGSTNQVVGAMDNMVGMIDALANHASTSAEKAKQTSEETQNSQAVIQQNVQSMNELSQEVKEAAVVIEKQRNESESIGQVLDVIKSISEQTNLLALNAAIEAARAGEQGRGFAVVADEVRTLAFRTRESTQEIEKMIDCLQSGAKNAVQVIESGVLKAALSVDQTIATEASLTAINTAIQSIGSITVEMAHATEEQSAVTNDIHQNIAEIKRIGETTQQESLRVNASSEALTELSERLSGLIGKFKTD